MSDVFISYSRKDKEFVHRLQNAFTEHEREPWLDAKDIPPTAEWMQEIYAAIEKADNFVFVISPEVLSSEVCRLELAHAVKLHKRLIPVVRRDVDPKDVPDILARLNWIFCREEDDFSQSFQALLTAMATDLDHVRAHTRLLLKALEWEGRGRDQSLLIRSNELKRAEEWLTEIGDKEPGPTPLMLQFLGASRKGATVRQRLTLGAVSFALLVAVSLALAAFYQYREARSQKETALARGLAAQSELLRSQQPHLLNRSVLLAVESLRRRPSLEGSLALQRGLALLSRRFATMSMPENEFAGEITLSPDGRWLVGWKHAGFGVSRDPAPGKVRLWDAETGRLMNSLQLEASPFYLVAFSSDSQRLITLTREGSIRVMAVPDGRELSRINLDFPSLQQAALSPDGKLLATSDGGPRATIHDTHTGRKLANLSLPDDLDRLLFTPDKGTLVTGCHDGTVQLWQLQGHLLTRFRVPRYVASLAVSPDGQYLGAVAGKKTEADDQTDVWVWHLPTGRATHIIPEGSGHWLKFSKNGLVVTDSTFNGVTVWRIEDGRQILRLKHPPFNNALAIGLSGRWLAVSLGTHAVQVYDLDTGREAGRIPYAEVFKAAFSPDERWLFTTSWYGAARWQFQGFEDMVLLPHDSFPTDIAFSPDGKLLASNGPQDQDQRTQVWETDTWQRLYGLKQVGSGLGKLFFSPDSRWLALVEFEGRSGLMSFYDLAGGKLAHYLYDPDEGLFAGFRDDSRAFFTLSGDYRRKVWDLATGKLLDTIPAPVLPPHLQDAKRVLSPDGKWFCAVGKDEVMRVCEVATGKERFQLGRGRDKFSEITNISFTPLSPLSTPPISSWRWPPRRTWCS
jgi:WD40 repeat protein